MLPPPGREPDEAAIDSDRAFAAIDEAQATSFSPSIPSQEFEAFLRASMTQNHVKQIDARPPDALAG